MNLRTNTGASLLLTSAGITNASIAQVVIDLVKKPAQEISVLFITTAANVVEGDKSWLITNLEQMNAQSYKQVDAIDIAGMPEHVWLPRMQTADVICFGGGNEQYLASAIEKAGINKVLPELLQMRVYMGISAGSMLAGHYLPSTLAKTIFPEEFFEQTSEPLKLVDIFFIPHLNSTYFSSIRKSVLERHKAEFTLPVYACDDNSAIKISNGSVEVVSEGEWVAVN